MTLFHKVAWNRLSRGGIYNKNCLFLNYPNCLFLPIHMFGFQCAEFVLWNIAVTAFAVTHLQSRILCTCNNREVAFCRHVLAYLLLQSWASREAREPQAFNESTWGNQRHADMKVCADTAVILNSFISLLIRMCALKQVFVMKCPFDVVWSSLVSIGLPR